MEGVFMKELFPFKLKKDVSFVTKRKEGNFIGVIKFRGKYESLVYYSNERSLMFLIISLVIVIVFIQVARWNPYKGVKELFDK